MDCNPACILNRCILTDDCEEFDKINKKIYVGRDHAVFFFCMLMNFQQISTNVRVIHAATMELVLT